MSGPRFFETPMGRRHYEQLFRRALHKELVAMGEEVAAALFAEPEDA